VRPTVTVPTARRIGLGAAKHPTVSAPCKLDRRDIDVKALKQLDQHCALGGDESLMQCALHAFEVFSDERSSAQCVDVRAQPLQRMRGPCIGAGRYRWDMEY